MISASEVSSSMISKLSGGPLAHGSHTLASAVSNGSILQAMTAVPSHLRELAFGAARASFVDGLNSILLIGAAIAFAAAVLTFMLIRQRDFVDVHPAPPEGAGPPAEAQAPRQTIPAG